MRVYGLGCSTQSLCRDDQSVILGVKRLDGETLVAYRSINPIPYLVFIGLTKDGVNLTLFLLSAWPSKVSTGDSWHCNHM